MGNTPLHWSYRYLLLPHNLAHSPINVMMRNVLRASGSVTLAPGALQIGLFIYLMGVLQYSWKTHT